MVCDKVSHKKLKRFQAVEQKFLIDQSIFMTQIIIYKFKDNLDVKILSSSITQLLDQDIRKMSGRSLHRRENSIFDSDL